MLSSGRVVFGEMDEVVFGQVGRRSGSPASAASRCDPRVPDGEAT